ncbi:Hypothetical protein CAP_4667 [Chondromyces apiculatus DSM 436]|uniref:Uncharacterized protein n=1 Tax=Chondromyces apiculatus DSM 436 TaxID=1192034 RepID=A0A017T5X2_9BACT|nr:Hypothetical protein CAP_4667 [Chondromyces apiculatus DSM 436]
MLAALEERSDLILDDSSALWSAIRRLLHWSAPDTDKPQETGSPSEDQDEESVRERWSRLYERFTPENDVRKVAWLFAKGIKLPNPKSHRYDIRVQTVEINRLREEALQKFWKGPEPVSILERLALEVKEPEMLATALATTSFAAVLDDIMFEDSIGPALRSLLPRYAAIRQLAAGLIWLKKRIDDLLDAKRRDDVKAILRALSPWPQVWNVIDDLPDDLKRAYWLGVEFITDDNVPREDLERALCNMLDAGNVCWAMTNVAYSKTELSPEVVVRVLKTFAISPPAEANGFVNESTAPYMLEQLLQRLESLPEAETLHAQLLVDLELIYACITPEAHRPLRHLSAAFAASPQTFIEQVKRRYRRRHDPPLVLTPEEQEPIRQRAEAACRLLVAWNGYPGQGEPPQRAEEILHDWSLQVLRSLVAEDRASTGASEVARVLARAPDAEDGHWPCIAARRLLELEEFPRLSHALQMAKWNMRGMTRRSLGEGGKQERALASRYRDAAKAVALTWPRSADMLDELAASYEWDAVRQDAEAQITLREEGAEAADFEDRPRQPEPPARQPAPQLGIVNVEAIELHDFAGLEHLGLRMTFPVTSGQSAGEVGQWVVLFGENARGKTSIVRAIALTLAGADVAQAALAQHHAPLVRIGRDSARCKVISGGGTFSATITAGAAREVVACETPGGARPLLFGYGCRRSSALGRDGASAPSGPSPDVATLFGSSSHVHPASDWLQYLKRRASRGPVHEHVLRTVTETLCALLPGVERMDVTDDKVWCIAPDLGGRIPLQALSDGYLTMLGWLVDMIACWVRMAEQNELDLAGDFLARMEGLVLLDDLDLNLHPRWQREVIQSLKKAFPRLSFVVTVHHALTLLGAKAEEVCRLELREGQVVAYQPEGSSERGAPYERL